MVLVMAAVVAGCGGDSGDDVDIDASPSTTAQAATTVPSSVAGTTVPAASLTLRVTDVRLFNSEESDSGMRILLPAGVASASVTITGLPSPNQVISVCQARELDRRLNVAVCRTPANGEAVNVALGSAATGVELVQVGVAGPGATGNSSTLDEVIIRYAASSRELSIRLPQIAAGEAGGTPSFGLTPPSTDGAYRATLTWTIIPVFGGSDSRGQLQLVEGGAATKAQTGPPGVQLTGNVATPVGNVAVRVQNIGTAAMVTPTLTAVLP